MSLKSPEAVPPRCSQHRIPGVAVAHRGERILNEGIAGDRPLAHVLTWSLSGVAPGRTSLRLDRCQYGVLDVTVAVR